MILKYCIARPIDSCYLFGLSTVHAGVKSQSSIRSTFPSLHYIVQILLESTRGIVHLLKQLGGNLISAPTTDLQGRYGVISIKWPRLTIYYVDRLSVVLYQGSTY
jgi:hypothetical protein